MFGDVEGPSFIFWPVGCGDSTTVVISDNEVLQIDLNDTAIAEADDNEKIPLVDELVAKLPKKDGKPYLSCFVLTHPDEDHCRGFVDLLKRVTIGELWHTPRVFREYHKDQCADAKAFRKEAKRRVAATIKAGGDPGAGHRVRVVGHRR
jgi:beta-lactamase superfamily II metal-dependent hydrolase